MSQAWAPACNKMEWKYIEMRKINEIAGIMNSQSSTFSFTACLKVRLKRQIDSDLAAGLIQ
jgi:hypothetical protein